MHSTSSVLPNEQLNDYIRLSEELLEKDSLKALEYARQAYNLADSLTHIEGKMKAALNIAWAYYLMDKYQDGLHYGLEVFHLIEDNRISIEFASLIKLLGHIYRKTGNFDFALKYYTDALKVYEELEDDYNIAFIYRFIAIVYSHIKSFEHALDYSFKALDIFKKLNIEERTATVMLTLGDIYKEINDQENGILFNSNALEIYKKYNNHTGIAYCYINLGNIYCNNNSIEKAEQYYFEALDICKKIDDLFGIAHIYYYVANLYMKKKQDAEVVRYLDMGLKAVNLLNSQYLQADFYKRYSDYYAEKENYKDAFAYYALFSEVKEKMTSKKYKAIIDQIQTEYDLYKKGKEVEVYRLKTIELKKTNEELDQAYNKIKEQNLELRNMAIKLEKLSKMDELTEVYNRRGIKEKLMQLKVDNEDLLPYSLILCDIDNFKHINDKHGHQFGDHVLKEIAGIFKIHIHHLGYVARWGGEEFLLIIRSKDADSVEIANHIRKRIENTVITYQGLQIDITMTFGISSSKKKSFEDSIREADQAMYYGKNNGRNCVVTSADLAQVYKIIR